MSRLQEISKAEAERIYRELVRASLLGGKASWENPPEWPFVVGQVIHIRAVPLYYIGRVVRWTDKVINLTNAAWVRDTGNFQNLWHDPSGAEFRLYLPQEEVSIALDGISDWTRWPHDWPLREREAPHP